MAKTSKNDRAIKSLSVIIPEEQLTLSKEQITAVVRKTDSFELHERYAKMNGFMSMFTQAVKEEFLERVCEEESKKIVTDIGVISYQERANYTIDQTGVSKFLSKHKISLDKVFDTSYEVITQNEEKLAMLEDKGYITKVLKLNNKNLIALVEKYPELNEFIENNPTKFVKGLG